MVYTDSELEELKKVVDDITTHIPKDKASYIWNNYNKIQGSNETQPCMCPSSAKYWGNALRVVKAYVVPFDEK